MYIGHENIPEGVYKMKKCDNEPFHKAFVYYDYMGFKRCQLGGCAKDLVLIEVTISKDGNYSEKTID